MPEVLTDIGDYDPNELPRRIWGDTDEGYAARVAACRGQAKARIVRHNKEAAAERIGAELSRLERGVIEAAKKWLKEERRINATTYDFAEKARQRVEAQRSLVPPIRALIDFESQQIKK